MMVNCSLCGAIAAAKSDPTFITEFEHSIAFAYWDQDTYPGRAMLVAKQHHEHLHLMPHEMQSTIAQDMSDLTAAILSAFGGFRANHMSLGNQMPHVHWHIVPRYPDDLNAGNAPIHSPNERRLSEGEYRNIAARIHAALA